jgi:dihydrofolate reductase
MVVVTRSRRFSSEGVHVAHSLEEALDIARDDDEPFIGGGAHIYRMALENDRVDRIYLTRIHAEVEGDTFFPKINLDDWELGSDEYHEADEKNEFPYSFLVYERGSE